MQNKMITIGEVLIFADPEDYNASAVQWMLSKNGISSTCVESVSDLDSSGVSVLFDDKFNFHTKWKSREQQIRSVWYRRAQDPKPAVSCDPRDVPFVLDEWKSMHRGLFFAADCFLQSFWVNRPMSAINAENKLLQLKLAKDIGLNVPATLVSNDPAEIRRFISRNSLVIIKTFSPHVWSDENKTAFGTSVSLLDSSSELNDESLAICPAIYQSLVDKVCDIRVTIIGNRLFPAKLVASKGGALLDWRPSTFTADLVLEPIELPAVIEQQLLLLQAKLGLVFGCVDLAIDRRGNYFFFEVNQSGQFMFVEELLPDLPLLRAFCAMLAQARPDYSMDSMADLGYCDYKNSLEYHRLAQMRRTQVEAMLEELELARG